MIRKKFMILMIAVLLALIAALGIFFLVNRRADDDGEFKNATLVFTEREGVH